jgi:hypothetical protein
MTLLQKRTVETQRAQRFPSIALCVHCASAVKELFCRRLTFAPAERIRARKRACVDLHIPIFDGHNDTLLRLFASKQNDSFFNSTQGHIDLARARAGGFAGGFFAVFVPSEPDEQPVNDDELPERLPFSYALETALAMTALLFRIEAQSAGQVRVVRTVDDIEHGIRTNTLSAILHFEGADAIDTEFHTLDVLYRAGLRSLGIVWSRPNAFGWGVPFRFPHDSRYWSWSDRSRTRTGANMQPPRHHDRSVASERSRLLGCGAPEQRTAGRNPLERICPLSLAAQPDRPPARRDPRVGRDGRRQFPRRLSPSRWQARCCDVRWML